MNIEAISLINTLRSMALSAPTSKDKKFYFDVVNTIKRLSNIEHAATALFLSENPFFLDHNTKALATALSNSSDYPAEQSRSEDLLVRALAALVYHTQQTRPITESDNLISALKAYLTNQCAEQAEDPDRPSAIELQDAEIGIPVPVTEPVHANPFTHGYALAWLVENVKVWGEFPATKIPFWEFFMFPDSMKVVLINIVNGVEITEQDWQAAQPGRDWKAAEVGIPEPFTPVINPCKEAGQT